MRGGGNCFSYSTSELPVESEGTLYQTDVWEGMIHKALGRAASAGKRGAKASRRESLDPKITLSVDRVDNVQLNRAVTAENVARMIINRGRSSTESLRKGGLLQNSTICSRIFLPRYSLCQTRR